MIVASKGRRGPRDAEDKCMPGEIPKHTPKLDDNRREEANNRERMNRFVTFGASPERSMIVASRGHRG